ncbi:aspartyl protease AED3-like [Olea europaea var. sylvestris]|uniref:aspartyl protease AED3-like n=1 Tax=Olea europaea var. sylvestris TaxID=158386 RepID=UPI000C1D633A|nr:aspartyl protease AED3-like [Olea europaea var. sylvestris]XP_022866863.1 aspartyl protease AED3-like [Olea europaea var. sylvestris]XP_022866864.1 aspartyl protease AED3-like [Olea europaea var. sylvestris]XP_022866865.1 aspartyl protease AED3-like [Olea europaea var. sylvestris]
MHAKNDTFITHFLQLPINFSIILDTHFTGLWLSKIISMELAIVAILLSSLLSTALAFDPCADSSDLSVIPIYGKCSPFNPPKPASSLLNTVMKMASKDPERVSYLSSLVAAPPQATRKGASVVPIAPGKQVLNIGNYVLRAKIGNPGQLLFMVLDTSSDAAWVPCSGCTGCAASSAVFTPKASSTYSSLDCSVPECTKVSGVSCPATDAATSCSFNQSYGGDSSFSAILSHDTLWLANDAIPNYAFGCINSVSGGSVPPQGLLGMGRGSMSLLSQSGSLYSGVFSYCLPSFKSYYFSGSLKLGPLGQPKNIRTTPLLKNPHRPSLYYVNLTGVSIGKVQVPIAQEPLAFDPNTGAGTIIDSGTVITRFVQPVYNAIRDEFRKQVKGPFSSLGAFDTCFLATNEDIAPPVVLHFTGMDLVLPMENSLIHSSSGSLACLAMAAAPNNVNSVLNIIANFQQQNLRILFDTVNYRLGIARELCN